MWRSHLEVPDDGKEYQMASWQDTDQGWDISNVKLAIVLGGVLAVFMIVTGDVFGVLMSVLRGVLGVLALVLIFKGLIGLVRARRR